MILVTISVLIALYAWFHEAHFLFNTSYWKGDLSDLWSEAPFGLFLLFMAFVINLPISIIPNAIATPEYRKYEVVSEQELIALKDDNYYLRRIMLAEGGKIKYSYIVDGQFGYEMKQLDISSATIRYTAPGEKPYIQTLEGKFKNPIVRALFLDMGDTRTIFYVPKGSIVVEDTYEIDMGS